MLAYTYVDHGKFELREKPKPVLLDPKDAIVRVTLGSICTSDLHIKHGSVPRAVPGITVVHEMVGIVESVGEGKINTTPLITYTYPLRDIEAAYELFENRRDGVIKVAITCE